MEIKRKENARQAVRRVGRRLAGKALSALQDGDTLEAVHEVRKDIKQLRALLRLVQSGLGRRECRCVTKKLKKTAARLAPSRDAFVKTSALAGLSSHFKHAIPLRAFEGIKQLLAQDCRNEQKKLGLKRSRSLLKKICRDFGSMDASRSGWKVIGPGIKRSYRTGQRASWLARETGSPEDFHEWRMRAKDLMYQVRFLSGIWPEQMNAMEAELDQLGEYLGDAHDLSVLDGPETLKQLSDQPREEIEILKTLAKRRQKELYARALDLGAKLYHDTPSSFCKRLHQYWLRWRQKVPRAPMS